MFRRLLPCLAALTVVSLHAAPAVPLANLVDEHSLFVVEITDAPALVKSWDGSPFAKTWNDPQVAKFFAPLREKMQIDDWDAKAKAATGSTVRELLALADGEALFSMPPLALDELKKKHPPALLLAIHTGDHAAKIEKLMADSLAKDHLHDQTEQFAGVTLHLMPTKDGAAAASDSGDFTWAQTGGVWLGSLQKERVQAAIDALQKGGADGALGKNVRFLAARDRIGDAQALFYLNIASAYPLVKEAVAAQKAKNPRGNPMGIDPETVLGALGLDALGEAYWAVHIGAQDTRMDFGFTYTEERGLLKLLAYQPGPAPQPDWIPAKWPSVSAGRFSVSQAYSGLEEMLEAISPLLSGMAQGQITALNRKLGIDLKRDLIGSLGDQMVSAYALPPGLAAGETPPWDRMDQFFALSLSNSDSFLRATEALKQMAGGPAADQLFTKRDYLGQTIYTLTPHTPPGAKPARGFSYAIANRTLLLGVGSAATVENALQGMRDGDGAFWKRDDIKAALAGVPAEASTVQFMDMRVVVSSLFELAARGPIGTGKAGAGLDTFIDVSAKPDADVIGRYWGLASGYSVKTATGFFGTTHLAYPQP